MSPSKHRGVSATLSTCFLILLIVPQVAFAAWWNPFTWGIFSFLKKTPSHEQTTTTPNTSTKDWSVLANTENEMTVSNDEKSKGVVEHEEKEKVQVPSDTTLCNGTPYTHCPSDQKFVCPKTGKAYCEIPPQVIPKTVSPNTLICNGKEWLACPHDHNFYCPTQGDAQCIPQATISTNVVTETPVPNQVSTQEVEKLLQQEIDKQNSWYEEYLRKQAEIDEKLKPVNAEWDRVYAQIQAECPIAFYTGQKARECDLLTSKLNSLNAEASRISGIYPERATLPKVPTPQYQQWRIDSSAGGRDGTIWSPNSTTRYRWSCMDAYSCTISSY